MIDYANGKGKVEKWNGQMIGNGEIGYNLGKYLLRDFVINSLTFNGSYDNFGVWNIGYMQIF